MKKFLATVLVAAMSMSLLTGCGEKPAEGNGDGQSAGTPSGEVQEVSLKVWCPQNQVETGIMEEQQKAFEAAHPEYKITWTTEVVGEDKCQESVLKDVGAAADVFMYASDQVNSLVEAGAIARLGGETEAYVKENTAASVVDTVTVDGALYGIPFTHNTFFMFYDKSI